MLGPEAYRYSRHIGKGEYRRIHIQIVCKGFDPTLIRIMIEYALSRSYW
jgi:hypothetical protein